MAYDTNPFFNQFDGSDQTMSVSILQKVLEIANCFQTGDPITTVAPYGSGNVNDTYLAISASETRFILQKVNTRIFTAPQTVMSNMHKSTRHIQQCIDRDQLEWKVQKIIQTQEGNYYLDDETHGFWRMISFIEESHSFDILDSHSKALELGKAVGRFHTLMAQMPRESLSYVLEDFHVVPAYLREYDKIIQDTMKPTDPDELFAFTFIQAHRSEAQRLEQGKVEGVLPLRIIHGDLKINNILFDIHNDAAISIIDLDTIQPGLIHYDIGDCMRSSCNRDGEETQQWKAVYFDTERFRYIWRGYLEYASTLMDEVEYDYIYDAVFAITFEIGLRFFTDYLNGDTYFKIHYPKNNLYRALVQLRLAQSIREQKEEIYSIVYHEIERHQPKKR